jgi:hypothetical protein
MITRLGVGARKLGLTIHVASSAGWFGAVAVFLALAIVATAILLLKLPVIDFAARSATSSIAASVDLDHARIELMIHAAGGILVLLAATILAIYKPWGIINRDRS